MGFHTCEWCHQSGSSADVVITFESGRTWQFPHNGLLHYLTHGYYPDSRFVSDVCRSKVLNGQFFQTKGMESSPQYVPEAVLVGYLEYPTMPTGEIPAEFASTLLGIIGKIQHALEYYQVLPLMTKNWLGAAHAVLHTNVYSTSAALSTRMQLIARLFDEQSYQKASAEEFSLALEGEAKIKLCMRNLYREAYDKEVATVKILSYTVLALRETNRFLEQQLEFSLSEFIDHKSNLEDVRRAILN